MKGISSFYHLRVRLNVRPMIVSKTISNAVFYVLKYLFFNERRQNSLAFSTHVESSPTLYYISQVYCRTVKRLDVTVAQCSHYTISQRCVKCKMEQRKWNDDVSNEYPFCG